MPTIRSPPILVVVLSLVGLALLDNFLSEEPFVPHDIQIVGFYILPLGIILGSIALLPYLRQRLSIVRPRRTSNFVLLVATATSALLVVMWSAVYYQALFLGPFSILGTALVMKDVLIGLSIVVFSLTGVRIFQWFLRTGNKVVLGWSLMFLLAIPFVFVRLLPDYLPSINFTNLEIATRLVSYVGVMFPLYIMGFPYYGLWWLKWIGVSAVGDSMVIGLSFLNIFNVPLDNTTTVILITGLYYSTIITFIIYSRLVSRVSNPRAKDYYWGTGYGIGMYGAVLCAIDAGIPIAYPLSWYSALSLAVPAACFCYAAFTSAASYYSISEDVKREIRQDKGYLASIGEAQRAISTEEEITKFYDRFTGLARESGAVEASSITKDEISSYVTAVRKMKSPLDSQANPA